MDKSRKGQGQKVVTASSKAKPEVEVMFEDYLARTPDSVNGALNMSTLDIIAEDVGLPSGDVVTLMLAWKLNCIVCGQIAQSEWVYGLTQLKVTTQSLLRVYLHSLRDEVYGSDELFTLFYNYVYDFLRTDTSKLMPLAVALLWWQKLLSVHFRFLHQWSDFIVSDSVGPYVMNGVTRDLWKQLLVFALATENLKDHNPDGEYPVLLDEFAVWAIEGASG